MSLASGGCIAKKRRRLALPSTLRLIPSMSSACLASRGGSVGRGRHGGGHLVATLLRGTARLPPPPVLPPQLGSPRCRPASGTQVRMASPPLAARLATAYDLCTCSLLPSLHADSPATSQSGCGGLSPPPTHPHLHTPTPTPAPSLSTCLYLAPSPPHQASTVPRWRSRGPRHLPMPVPT